MSNKFPLLAIVILATSLMACQTAPPPPVSASEYDEAEYLMLLQEIASLRAIEAQLDAQCTASVVAAAQANQRENIAALHERRMPLPPQNPSCASVFGDLSSAERRLERQKMARELYFRQQAPSSSQDISQ